MCLERKSLSARSPLFETISMKKTFIYLFILLCFACRNKQEYTLCGTLYMDSNTVVDMLGIQMEDTLLYVKVDSAGYFSTTIPFREVVFCNLFGVAVTGEERCNS